MKIVSLITARGGSKGIPNKNIIDVNGKPLISYSISASLDSDVDETWVSTDSDKIKMVSEECGSKVIDRPKHLADDISMPDDSLLHFAKNNNFDILVFIQPTSPMIKSEYINKGIKMIKSDKYDSVFKENTMIICEIGLNHMGNRKYSDKYVETLLKTNCDAITYQIREKEFYERDKYKGFDFSFDYYSSLIQKLKGKKKFGVALANKNMITECESIGVDFYKVLSWDLKDYDYITDLLDKTSKHIYVSTGTSSISDLDKFHKRFGNINRLSFIHTQLTFEAKDTNLKSIQTISDKYNIPVGYGNHCKNLNTMYSSLSFSPSDIWFYVKGSDYETHPDEIHSVPLNDVGEFIENLKEVNLSIGDGWKKNTNTKGY
jgi:sialic acid synthase SpsE